MKFGFLKLSLMIAFLAQSAFGADLSFKQLKQRNNIFVDSCPSGTSEYGSVHDYSSFGGPSQHPDANTSCQMALNLAVTNASTTAAGYCTTYVPNPPGLGGYFVTGPTPSGCNCQFYNGNWWCGVTIEAHAHCCAYD